MVQDYPSFSYKNNPLTYLVYVTLLVLSLLSTVYVAWHTPNQPGTGFYFTLPLTFFICLLFFKDVIPYHEGGYALKVFYFFCALRYVFLPFFTCKVGHFATSWSSSAFSYAIFIQVVELLTSFLVIKFTYRKQFSLLSSRINRKKTGFYEDLSFGGIMVILLALALIAIRGVSALTSSMRLLVVSEELDESAYYGYDRWMAQTMQAFFAVVVTSHFQKLYSKNNSFWYVIIPLIVCLLSCIVVFGNNRMMVIYFAISGLSILTASFSKYKKGFAAVIIIALSVVIFSFTMVKQYGVNVSQGERVDTGREDIAAVMATYVSSTEAIAKVFDMYGLTGDQMQPETFLADIIDKTMILQLPGFNFGYLESIPPSYRLAMTAYEVVPAAGQALYYGGYYLGWLIDIIGFWIVITLMIKCEIHSKLEINLANRYLYTWISVVFAMIMCYHYGIIYNVISYVPFFLWIALSVNRKLRLEKITG